jgi:undecaprenyl diphosphate synthase
MPPSHSSVKCIDISYNISLKLLILKRILLLKFHQQLGYPVNYILIEPIQILIRRIQNRVQFPQLKKDGVQLHFVGSREGLSAKVSEGLAQAEAATADNNRLILNVCFNYGGRWDIAQAAAGLAAKGMPITEASLHAAMGMSHVPDPDLIIRTGGEMRISNFLLWQAAYSELFFSDRLWPDFDEAALDEALDSFQSRERRFGKTSEQIASAHRDPMPG